MTHGMTDELRAQVPTELFINGRWQAAASSETFDVSDPATGERLATVASAGVADATAALDAAHRAKDDWAATPARERSEMLRRAFSLVTERAEDFALLMTLEMGKSLEESRGEVAYGAEFLRWFAEEAVRVRGTAGVTPERSSDMLVTRHAVGPCYLITPWNFPLAMATRKIAPALAAGCPVVIKPASLTPLTTLMFVDLLREAGVPDGVVNAITTVHSAHVSEPLIRDPRLRKLSFTGSTAVGVNLLAQASNRVLRTSMELGGNAPFIVFDDADLDAAVDGAMAAKFRNIGQACTAANRFLVHESVAEEFTRRITERVEALTVGPGADPNTDLGPLIDADAVDKVERLVADAVDRGAQVRTGGHSLDRSGTFYAPTVITEVRPGSALLTEEIFGPVLAMATFATEDEAVTRANDTEHGLVSYVFTQSLARTRRMVAALHSGMIGVNSGVVSNAAAPFGGSKMSGIGREGGAEGIYEYLETKYTLLS